MLLQLLATANFGLGTFDAYVTRRRIKDYGANIELNSFIKAMATRLGPEIATFIGVLGPISGWILLSFLTGWTLPLAVLLGMNIKRFEIQMISVTLERDERVRKILQQYKQFGSAPATLPGDSKNPKADPPSPKEDVWKYSERK